MKQAQVCVKDGYARTQYFNVIIDNSQSMQDAIKIVKKNLNALHIGLLAYVGAGLNGVQHLDQYNKHKAGTVIDGDWNSVYFGEVLIKGGDK